MQKVEINGEEIEVYTAAEVDAAKTAALGEVAPKLTDAQKEIERLNEVLLARSKEFSEANVAFKRLSDEQVVKLDEKDRIIYQNQLSLSQEREKSAVADKKVYEAAVATAIRARVGINEDLFKKVNDMYVLIGLEDGTPEQITARVAAAAGAVGGQTPDLLASVGLGGGAAIPPTGAGAQADKESFADTDQGKAAANELGLKIEYTEEEKKRLGIA